MTFVALFYFLSIILFVIIFSMEKIIAGFGFFFKPKYRPTKTVYYFFHRGPPANVISVWYRSFQFHNRKERLFHVHQRKQFVYFFVRWHPKKAVGFIFVR